MSDILLILALATLLGSLAWQGYLIFMALNFSFIPLIYFVRIRIRHVVIHGEYSFSLTITVMQFYPETTNLTLEDIDFLFTEDGADGLPKLGRKRRPVQESVRPSNEEMAQDVEKGRLSTGGEQLEHVERVGEKST